jgi:hypothetical protein
MDSPPAGTSLRFSTWPLAGFIFGFLLSPPPRPDAQFGPPSSGDVLIVSFGVGCASALIAFVVACVLDKRRGATRSAMPFSDERPVQALVFTLCFVGSLWLKTFGHWGVAHIILGAVPVWIVLRGGAKPQLPPADQ